MQKIFVKPAEGLLVRREDGKPLSAEGEPVDRTSFWLRRERDGDVTISDVAVTEGDQPAEQVAVDAQESASAKKKTAKA